MRLAVFSDHGIGRYFAQLFDHVPEAVFYLSEKNKSGLSVTAHERVILSERAQTREVMRHPWRALRRLRENGYDRRMDFHFFELQAAVSAGRFDVALTAAERSLYTLASLKAGGRALPLVYWVPFTIPFVDMFAERSFRIRQYALPMVDRFITITRTCYETLALEGIDERRLQHIYPGIDLDAFRPRDRAAACAATGLDPERFNLLFVGKLVSWKGCYTLLYAAKLLAAAIPNLALVMVGRGAQQQGLEQAASLLGIGERVRFIGFVEYERMPQLYSAADLFVLPSLPAVNLAEQFGYVVAEAMASATPPLVSRVGGLPEVVGRDERLLFVPGDYRELAQRILALYRDPGLRRAIGERCRELACERYDARRNGEAIRRLAQELSA